METVARADRVNHLDGPTRQLNSAGLMPGDHAFRATRHYDESNALREPSGHEINYLGLFAPAGDKVLFAELDNRRSTREAFDSIAPRVEGANHRGAQIAIEADDDLSCSLALRQGKESCSDRFNRECIGAKRERLCSNRYPQR